jgi:hypothetical protein
MTHSYFWPKLFVWSYLAISIKYQTSRLFDMLTNCQKVTSSPYVSRHCSQTFYLISIKISAPSDLMTYHEVNEQEESLFSRGRVSEGGSAISWVVFGAPPRSLRSAHDAADAVAERLLRRHGHVIDANVSQYLDIIPSANLTFLWRQPMP